MRISLLSFAFLITLILVACRSGPIGTVYLSPDGESTLTFDADRLPTPTPFPEIAVPDGATVDPSFIPSLSLSIPPDAIRPVYAPRFVNAQDAELHPEELVMGVAADGEAKAYPVTVLRFREMVNDELAGLPILVTW